MDDPITVVLRLLEEEWDSEETDGVTPLIQAITDSKTIDLAKTRSRSAILVKRPTTNPEYAGIGGRVKNEYTDLNLDIRTTLPESSYWKIVGEAVRILEKRQKTTPGYDILNSLQPGRVDLSNRSYALYRCIIPVRLERYARTMEVA